jgi:uncharacterized membrane protein
MNVRDKRDEAVKLFLNFISGSLYLIILMIIIKYPAECTLDQKAFYQPFT